MIMYVEEEGRPVRLLCCVEVVVRGRVTESVIGYGATWNVSSQTLDIRGKDGEVRLRIPKNTPSHPVEVRTIWSIE
jgi:hypothetical protein